MVSRKLGQPTPAEGELDEVFFYGKEKVRNDGDSGFKVSLSPWSLDHQKLRRLVGFIPAAFSNLFLVVPSRSPTPPFPPSAAALS